MSTKTAKKKRHRRPSASRQARPRPATEPRQAAAAAPRRRPTRRRRRPRFDPSLGQVGLVGAIALVAALFFFGGRGSSGGEVTPTAAPPFTMPSTAGGDVSLSDLSGHNVLLYFNEGVGCDACFYQTLELEKESAAFTERDITILPIVMNDIGTVEGELQRFEISTPYLIDTDGSVSNAYGVLGKGMHANLPGHGFVFIDATGQIRWQKEYDSMYASASEVIGAVDRLIG
jgi:peroxiredoxin